MAAECGLSCGFLHESKQVLIQIVCVIITTIYYTQPKPNTFFDEKKGNDVPLTCPWSRIFLRFIFTNSTKLVKGECVSTFIGK